MHGNCKVIILVGSSIEITKGLNLEFMFFEDKGSSLEWIYERRIEKILKNELFKPELFNHSFIGFFMKYGILQQSLF